MNIKKRSFKKKIHNLARSSLILLIMSSFIKIITTIFPAITSYFDGYGVYIVILVVGGLFFHAVLSEVKSLLEIIKLKTSKK